MTLYMYQASYTAKAMAAQLKEPQDPMETMRPTLVDLCAKILVTGFPFGEYDVLVVYEAPDDMTAASVAMAVAAAGEVKSAKTTRLLSGRDTMAGSRSPSTARRTRTSRRLGRRGRGPPATGAFRYGPGCGTPASGLPERSAGLSTVPVRASSPSPDRHLLPPSYGAGVSRSIRF